MKINVTENKVSIKEEQILNENEYNIHRIQFDFSSEYTDDLVKVALFSIDNHTYKKIISNNECDIPPEVLTQRGYSILGVYAYKAEQDTLVLRYSPSPTRISVYDGSYQADAENSEPITPSEIEQYQQILQNSLQQFQNQYNALVEETEGDIQAIQDELQRKVDEGYFDGEDGFSPIAKVIQKSNGATIEIEDKNGKTTADVLNGEDGYTPVRGVDYWTEEDKQEVEEEATQQIDGKIEEYNENAAEKLNQYNQNSVQKTNDYNTNAEQKMSVYNTNATEKTSTYNSNATEKFNNYNSNAEQKETNYNTNASQKVEFFNTNASSKLSEYNSNAETKKSAYDENATQKTNSFNTNATNKLTEYNTNHTQKMSAYNSNNTEKLNAFNENATQKTEDFDEHTEQIQTDIEVLQRTDDEILSNFNKFDEVTGEDITLNETTEIKFAKPPLPMGNSEQESTTGKNLFKPIPSATRNGITFTNNGDGSYTLNGTATAPTSFYIVNVGYGSGTYALSANNPVTNSGVILQLETSNGNKNTALNAINKTLIDNCDDINVLTVIVSNGTTLSNFVIKPQLELGNSATDFEPYTNGASPNPDYPQEITNVTGDVEVLVQNKNLFDKDNVINAYLNADGTTTSNNTFRVSDYINIKGLDNITISGNYGGSEFCCFYDKNKEFISYFGMGSLTTRVASVPTNAEYVRVTVRQDVINKYQLEQGSTASPYTSHKEQVLPLTLGNIELCKIGDCQDYFYKESNKWYLHKEIGKEVLNGTQNIAKNDSDSSNYLYYMNLGTRKIGGTVLSNKLTYKTLGQINGGNDVDTVGISTLSTSRLFYFNLGYYLTVNTVAGVNSYLTGNNITVYYQLEEPVNTEITDTTLISQLEAINNAISYEEQTNISGSSDESNPIFTVQAYKSLNKELNNKVDKVQGKELSSNDFTDTLKEKLEGLENYDDTEIKADISDIQNEQTEQNTDIEKLQTENARFKATLPTTGEVTGQDITLDKTAELEFIKPPLPMGNSEQESTEGYQLLDTIEKQSYTQNGITVTNNGDGSFTLNGTNTNSSYIDLYITPNTNSQTIIKDLENGTYLLKIYELSGNINFNSTNCYVVATGKGENNQYLSSMMEFALHNNKQYQVKSLENCKLTTVKFYIGSGVTFNNYKFKIMLAQSSDISLEWEPYTNGASPNPDYPQEITNVTGDVEVKVQNKNLFDYNYVKEYSNTIFNSYRFIEIKGIKASTWYTIYNYGNLEGFNNVYFADDTKYEAIRFGTLLNNRTSRDVQVSEAGKLYLCCYAGTWTETVWNTFIDNFKNAILIQGRNVESNNIPHQEQTFTFPLGNEKLMLGDYLADDGIHHKMREDDLSTLTWASLGSNLYRSTAIDNIKIPETVSTIPNILAEKYKARMQAGNFLNGEIAIMGAVNAGNLLVCDETGTPSGLIQYELEQEVIVPYTSTQQTVYNAIKEAISYEEQTNISGLSDGSNPIFSVEGYQSTKLVLEERDAKYESLEARVALLE